MSEEKKPPKLRLIKGGKMSPAERARRAKMWKASLRSFPDGTVSPTWLADPSIRHLGRKLGESTPAWPEEPKKTKVIGRIKPKRVIIKTSKYGKQAKERKFHGAYKKHKQQGRDFLTRRRTARGNELFMTGKIQEPLVMADADEIKKFKDSVKRMKTRMKIEKIVKRAGKGLGILGASLAAGEMISKHYGKR
jgi:hypothetical protein